VRAVVGLGNPGKLYEFTRHNVGFSLLNIYAVRKHLTFKPSKQNYYYAKGGLKDSSFILVEPATFMNLSGIAVKEIVEKYQIMLKDLLIIHDDVDLELGKIKIKQNGSGGGHNGISSIIYQLNSNQFPRLRIGIGNEFQKGKMVEFVLDKFFDEEMDKLKDIYKYSCELIEKFINGGLKSMLDYFSNPPDKNIKDLNN
jgi:PTH1 family peptidyl-tRNA hydrolase